MNNLKYEIAKIEDNEKELIRKVEIELKQETGKDFVLVAWEKK